MSQGAKLIADERQRQVEREGYDAAHDHVHRRGELAVAAACYALANDPRHAAVVLERQVITDGQGDRVFLGRDAWPFDGDADKRKQHGGEASWWSGPVAKRVRVLQIAGALIAAEIDRLLLRDEIERGTP